MELKIVFCGDVGSGKTQAIRSISNIDTIDTDVIATDDVADLKNYTTVGMDYGEVSLDTGELIRLYGTPGQGRFDFMWDILAKNALGLIILINHQGESPLVSLDFYLNRLKVHIENSTTAIGITHVDGVLNKDLECYYDYCEKNSISYPIYTIDARDAKQVRLLIESMAAMIAED